MQTKEILEFKRIEYEDCRKYGKYLKGDGVCVCDKTPSCKVMWEGFGASAAESDGCLIIKNDSVYFDKAFDFPLSGQNGDVEKAVEKIEDYCAKKDIPLKFCALTENEVAFLMKRYSFFLCENNRNYRDYVYLADEMKEFKGKKYAGQRNHINKFSAEYPNAQFRTLNNADKPQIFAFLEEWRIRELAEKGKEAKVEFGKDEKFIKNADLDDYKTGAIVIDGRIAAFCLAEVAFDTTIIHIEKALHFYEGVNVYLVREFAKTCVTTYINREDDSGASGLRISKMQYKPLKIENEYVMTVKTEAHKISKIPTLQTPRLTLCPIEESDKEEYFRLATDEKLNEFWGYDYKADLDGELTVDYFYEVAKKDFSKRTAVNFAVKKDGKFIGETVIFEFNYRGECSVGVRIFAEYAGNGYGEEAFEKTVEFALYELGIKRVLSSCYIKNAPSVKMHEKTMRLTGKDEEKYYYAREY